MVEKTALAAMLAAVALLTSMMAARWQVPGRCLSPDLRGEPGAKLSSPWVAS
jgi:hypothetical protein